MATQLLTTDEVADLLRKPVSWIHANAVRVGLPRLKIGNHYRYRASDVDIWLEQQREA